MNDLTLRWEWRTFAKTIETRIDITDYPQIRQLESAEIYLASSSAQGNPKIRDGKIDVKILQQVDDGGLEQWKPVLKAPFPLSAEQLAQVYRALGLAAPADFGDCTFAALSRRIDEDPRTWSVAVDKVRGQYDVDGCVVEWSQVSFDGEIFRTVAAEDPDPAKVGKTVATLGLSERENVNYVEALQRIRAGTLA